ncbi:unnamed protein product [Caenorhabditis angaria]|uniref:Integrase zinc-binding domain-containing protein n=1 Tax=Caenorhabditis angaria TaxID=860376 RepID=A0A9P1ILG8_9PELO|nr:unnamed protein product [Caenorhabditis angaria]
MGIIFTTMMLHDGTQEIVDGNMTVETYEEIAVDDMNDIVVESETQGIPYEEDDVRSEDGDGYGGMSHEQYNGILEYKRTGMVPTNVDKRMDRSAPSHWRSRCNRFTVADDNETLLYYNPTSPVNDQPKVVVKRGEVRKALERIHELIGHLGQKRTQMVVLRKLYWRSVRQDVKNYIMSCDFCNQKKVEGRKIVKAPVDITSDAFDINVAVRDLRDGPVDRLEFTLIGYNEDEVRDAAFSRMTSYTFKETATEFRSRYSLRDTPVPTFRRQPYVKRNGQMAIGYLLPFQQRSRNMEPEFIEIYERAQMQYADGEGEKYEQDGEITDSLGRLKQDSSQPIAHPVTLDGHVLQGKRYFKEEEDLDVVVNSPDKNDEKGDREEGPQNQEEIEEQPTNQLEDVKPQETRIHARYSNPPSSSASSSHKRRFHDVHHEEIYPPDHEPATNPIPQPRIMQTSSKKRRNNDASHLHGIAGRFSMAIGENDRMDNDARASMMQQYEQQPTSSRPELNGLPPICMMPSLDSHVIEMQKEILQRHIRIQKMQEKIIQAQYDASMRIPITRYVQPTEHVVQEETIVEHEMDVIEEHTVYETEHLQ